MFHSWFHCWVHNYNDILYESRKEMEGVVAMTAQERIELELLRATHFIPVKDCVEIAAKICTIPLNEIMTINVVGDKLELKWR